MLWDVSKQIGKKISIKTKTGILYFDIESIRYIICDGHYCYIYFLGKSEGYRTLHSLKYFEEELEGLDFRRANYNTLINPRYIADTCFSSTTRTLHLTGGEDGKIESHIVSKRKVHLFEE